MGSFAPSTVDLKSIILQLTIDEKASLVAGRNFWETSAVARLGIPPLKVSDGPNGARGATFEGGVTSACFPASVSLAATWDGTLARRVGKALGEETKTKGARVLLGPTVCPHRHALGGRNFESFSEDPLLAGLLASDYIRGLQSQGVGATIKHFAVNEQETRRFTIDEAVSQRALREIYLKPFEIAIKKSDPWAVMTSYNLVNGTHSDMNKFLLQNVLREQWGWSGLVMSDWGGTNSLVESLDAGLDLEMPGQPIHRKAANIASAIKSGNLAVETLDKRVEAVLDLLVKTETFENPGIPEEQAINLPEHRQLIREAGAKGIVLLKNENDILPLRKEQLKSIAMIGLAKECLAHGGGSASVNSHYKVSPWDAFNNELNGKVELNYAEGARIIRNLPPMSAEVYDEDGNPGWTSKLYSTADRSSSPKISNIKAANHKVFENTNAKAVDVSGTYKPSKSGSHYLSFVSCGNTTVSINGEEIFKVVGSSADPMAYLLGVATEERKQYPFIAGQEYKIHIQAAPAKDTTTGLSILTEVTGFSIGFLTQEEFEANLLGPAIAAAQKSDVALVFVGHTPVWETEGSDRTSMDLPVDGSMDLLIAATAAVNPRTIVINSTGSPITMPWIDSVPAVIQAWFSGQEAGNSIADVILGHVNPSGKLPVTFPRSLEDTPAYGNFPGNLETEKVEYKEGIYIGYRHFDRHPETILFPFGFGKSYTSFAVSDVAIPSTIKLSATNNVTVTANITNTGAVAGSEVLQVYVGPSSEQSVDTPEKQLAGFVKVTLQPGEKKSTQISFDRASIAYWSEEKDKWVVEAGVYNVFAGTSSRDIVGQASFSVSENFEFDP